MMGNSSFAGLGNSSFASLTPAPASADEAEPWVRGELIRSLMRASRGSYLLAAALMPAMVGLSWGYVPPWQLFAWLAIGIGATACRIWGEQVYARHYADRDSAAQQYFVERYRYLWSASAFAWGLSILIFFERTPLVNQFMSWLIVAGVATFPLNGLALHPPLLKRYVNTLFVTMLAGDRLPRDRTQVRASAFPLRLPAAAGPALVAAAARGTAHPRDRAQQLRAAVPQPHPDQLAHAAAAGGGVGGGDEEPLSRQRRARHAPARAGAFALRRLAAQRARTGGRDRAEDRARHACGQCAVRLAVRPGAHRFGPGAAAHRAGGRGPAAARPRAAVPAGGRGQGPELSHARDAPAPC